MTLANILTLSRLALTPIIILLVYVPEAWARWLAFGLFIVGGISDCVDGWVARRFQQVSPLGTYLDPVVDKIVLLSLFFTLSDLRLLPLWISLLMLARELLVDGVRSAGAITGQVVGANFMGKTKATLQSISIGVALAVWALNWPVELCRLWVSLLAGITLVIAWIFAAIFLWWQREWLFVRDVITVQESTQPDQSRLGQNILANHAPRM